MRLSWSSVAASENVSSVSASISLVRLLLWPPLWSKKLEDVVTFIVGVSADVDVNGVDADANVVDVDPDSASTVVRRGIVAAGTYVVPAPASLNPGISKFR